MAKIKIGTTSNSVIVGDSVSNSHIGLNIENSSSLFSQLKNIVEHIQEQDDKNKLKDIVEKMEQSVGKPDYVSYYKEFTQVAANHLTLFSPFIPALSALIT